MRKVYLAVLSLFGLAGSSVPAQAQVLKGSKEAEAAKSSTVKSSKAAQENAAANDAGGHKHKKHIAGVKYKKNAAEDQAVKTQSEIKGRKRATMDASSKDAAKMTKSNAERNAAKINLERKDAKAGAAQYPIEHGKEASGVRKDAITVKQKTKTGNTTADVVTEKSGKAAAERNASKADSHFKFKKNSAATSSEHAIGEKRDKAIQEKNAPPQTPK
jgi:hypothetical protein